MDFQALDIQHTKLKRNSYSEWSAFFPYYAGYPEKFAQALLKSASLPNDAIVLDPWNGSGTTTFCAMELGLASWGLDINPVMVLVAKARNLLPTDTAQVQTAAETINKSISHRTRPADLLDDPILQWFDKKTARFLRHLETCIRNQNSTDENAKNKSVEIQDISAVVATLYVALFGVCRRLAAPFRASNPTWTRLPRANERLISVDYESILSIFSTTVASMCDALVARHPSTSLNRPAATFKTADSVNVDLPQDHFDFILTSPPYCTRIDYSAATRVELALIEPITNTKMQDLGRRMIGSTRVPKNPIEANKDWGKTCNNFLNALKNHCSKASSGYYYKTHLDYYSKMHLSLKKLSRTIKPCGAAVLVVQDSYYKDIHNDLPQILSEMAASAGLGLRRRVNFELKRTMSGINPGSKTYSREAGAVESVLCFEKSAP